MSKKEYCPGCGEYVKGDPYDPLHRCRDEDAPVVPKRMYISIEYGPVRPKRMLDPIDKKTSYRTSFTGQACNPTKKHRYIPVGAGVIVDLTTATVVSAEGCVYVPQGSNSYNYLRDNDYQEDVILAIGSDVKVLYHMKDEY